MERSADWLDQARRDLAHARNDLQQGFYDRACFSRARPVAPELRDAALELDKVYISAPYPDAHPAGSPRRRYTRAEAERRIGYAE